MPDRTCSVDGCERERHGATWCDNHYRRNLRFGSPTAGPPIHLLGDRAPCAVDGCDNYRGSKLGLCAFHVQRLRKTGSLDEPRRLGTCTVDGCHLREVKFTGWCRLHRARQERWGAFESPPKRETKCAVEECTNTANGGWGWCARHYRRWRTTGDPCKTAREVQIDTENESGVRVCVKCKLSQPLDNFRTHRRSMNGRIRECDQCMSERKARMHAGYVASDENAVRRRTRDQHLRRQYGISLDTYEAMSAAQGDLCGACAQPDPALHVDHDHATGAVRGLLCKNCNVALGFTHDSVTILESLIKYLIAHQPAPAQGREGEPM